MQLKVEIHMHSKLLGWCIVELVHNRKRSDKSCDKTMVKSVATGLLENHYFKQSYKVRDISVEIFLMKIYENNLVSPQLQHCTNKMIINYDCQGMTGDSHIQWRKKELKQMALKTASATEERRYPTTQQQSTRNEMFIIFGNDA